VKRNKHKRQWNAASDVLVSRRFPLGEAEVWANWGEIRGLSETEIVDRAVYFRGIGFSMREALAWSAVIWRDDLAMRLACQGWTPLTARMLKRRLCRAQPGAAPRPPWEDDESPVLEWVNACLPPQWCLRYIAAGVSPEQAKVLEDRREAGEDIGPQLDLLAALRGDPEDWQ
jgi:hypothetical protein